MEERYQLEEHFATPDYIGRTMSDPMTDENREDRVYDAEYMTKRVEARLNMVMPQILASADMLSVESEQKLLARLGVTRVGDGNEFSLMSSDWQSNEDQRAMYMVLNQNLRHSVINRQISIFNPDMDEDGTSRESIVNGGVDLLLLHLYQREAVQDCGRYFQEQVRKTVIRERIGEILLWEAQRTEATRSGESILRSNIRAAVDAIFVAEDMFGIINKGVNSVLSRIEPGSFMDKVVGGIASGVRGVKELFGGVADRVPSEFPMRATSRRKGGFFKMPDFFS